MSDFSNFFPDIPYSVSKYKEVYKGTFLKYLNPWVILLWYKVENFKSFLLHEKVLNILLGTRLRGNPALYQLLGHVETRLCACYWVTWKPALCLLLGHLETQLSTSYRVGLKPGSVPTTGFHGNPAVLLPWSHLEIWLFSGSVLLSGSYGNPRLCQLQGRMELQTGWDIGSGLRKWAWLHRESIESQGSWDWGPFWSKVEFKVVCLILYFNKNMLLTE